MGRFEAFLLVGGRAHPELARRDALELHAHGIGELRGRCLLDVLRGRRPRLLADPDDLPAVFRHRDQLPPHDLAVPAGLDRVAAGPEADLPGPHPGDDWALPVDQDTDARVIDLDDDDLETRERASEELKEAGHLAEAALRDGLAKGPSLEGRRRIGKLLKALDSAAPERLRFLRAMEVLEVLATPQARKQLERLADGAEDAKAALVRLRLAEKQRP